MSIRTATDADLPALRAIAAAMGTVHEAGYFEKCLREQAEGKRLVLLTAKADGTVMLNWRPLYPPFRRLDIPEIQDLNVVPDSRRQGLGRKLVEACEKAARQAGKTEIGISVGLYARFGAAQRLYVAMGYVPDGAGIAYDEEPVRAGEMRAVDDLLTLKLIKPLGTAENLHTRA